MLRYRYRPSKIAFLALAAWGDAARGDWRAPSDAVADAWLRELDGVPD